MKEGYAVVFNGGKRILDEPGKLPKQKRKVSMTKAQFTTEWNCRDEAGRRELMKTVIPVR